MKKVILSIAICTCFIVSACSNHQSSENTMKDSENAAAQPNVEVKPYKEPLSHEGQTAPHPLGVFTLKQISEPKVGVQVGPLHIDVQKIKVVQSKEVSEVGKYNLQQRSLPTNEMNAIQFTTTIENVSDQPLDLGKGPIKKLLLSNGESVDVYKMNADPKNIHLQAKEKETYTLICFLSKAPNPLTYIKITTNTVQEQDTKKQVVSPHTKEIKL
ncbi:hypothetical protein [Peribacillus sp. NPDC060253]|uniref:hypothetical protein n=1 Tax=Peribacillus sp. NPDC060253 TaxID=3347084 RepID=UPI003668F558